MEDDDLLTDIVDWLPLLEAARDDPIERESIEHHLGVSRATSYRIVGRLGERGLLEESNGEFVLTECGRRCTEAASTFESAVRSALEFADADRDRLIELLGLTQALEAVGDGPLDRRELERRLDVSKTTSYRFTRSLAELELIEKSGGMYERTSRGDVVAATLSSFETTVQTTLTLAPILQVLDEAAAEIPIEAFSDANVTSLDGGDAFGQVDRFIALVEETDSLRGIDLNAIAPMYIDEITKLVLEGMELEMISTPTVVEDTADKYPYACAKLCINGNVKPMIHDDLPFGLAILDDRVGIGVPHPDERRLRAFVDTNSSVVREWADAVFATYRDESIRLEQFSKKALRDALPDGEIGARS